MAKSRDSFNKKEKEKKRRKKQQEKLARKEARKAEKAESGSSSLDDMMAYVDEYGNITSTPPDPNKKKEEIKLEDIQLGAAPVNPEDYDPIRKGRVKFFNEEKGFGFIIDKLTQESVFVHVNNTTETIKENNMVVFEVEMGPKGPSAVNVKIDRG